MIVSLVVESVSHAKTTLVVEPGRPLRVGRTAPADYVVEDHFLSKLHFALAYDGQSCWMRDLKSTNGTRLNGLPASESKLNHGDTITAGQTTFTVHIADAMTEEHTAPSTPVIDLERLLVPMRRTLEPLYMVVDAAVDARILQLLLEAGMQYYSLLHGKASSRLSHFGPYLVPLPAQSPLLDTLVRKGWGNNWGVYLTSNAGPRDLWEFLTRLLQTRLPEGETALLRFYDSRVLRAMLTSSTPEQQRRLFGPIRSYLIEADEADQALLFSCGEHGLQKTEIRLSDAKPAQTTAVDRVSAPASDRASYANETTIFLPRQDQLKSLVGTPYNPYKQKLLEEVEALFPETFARAGKDAMAKLIEYGCTRPRRYGISAPEDLRHYIFLMVQLGCDFDVDPQMPWAASLLARRLAPAEKLNKLRVAAASYKRAECG
jgi:hypothetical protein